MNPILLLSPLGSLVASQASVIGTIPMWLLFVAVILGALIFWRGGGHTAIASLEVANRVLEKRVHDQDIKIAEQNVMIEELQRKTNVAIALEPLVTWQTNHEDADIGRHEELAKVFKQIASRIDSTDRRSEAQNEKMMTILGMMADSLAKLSPNGDH